MAGLMERIGETVKGRVAAAELDPVENEIRRFILREFARTGKAPGSGEIVEGMGLSSINPIDRTIEKLEAADILTRKEGNIVSSYPFSAVQTRHRVIFDDGHEVYALCATDALGIHFMLNEPITILSRCPWCEGETLVTIRGGRIDSYSPEGIIEFVAGNERGRCTAESCCPFINLFCSGEHLASWRKENPRYANGETYTLDEALKHGRIIFGDFLDK